MKEIAALTITKPTSYNLQTSKSAHGQKNVRTIEKLQRSKGYSPPGMSCKIKYTC